MVVKRQCSFCAREIEPGTGMMFVKRDGTVFHFCTSSCRKQQLHLHRVGHHFKWTRAHELKRAADRSSAQKAPAAPMTAKAARGRLARRPEKAAAAATEPSPVEAAPVPAQSAPPAEPTASAPAKKPRRPHKPAEGAKSE